MLQLTETLARRVEALPGQFGKDPTALVRELTAIHGYLNGVLREWQSDPTVMGVGATTATLGGWTQFRGFVGYDDAAVKAFRDGVADRVSAVEVLIQKASAQGGRRGVRTP